MIDPILELLIVAAQNELACDYPELYKIFLLSLMAGLRREEVDKLLWSQIKFAENIIRIETTKHYQPKSVKSEGDVQIDPELMKFLEGIMHKQHLSLY